jgi:hypothetical protein
MDAFKAIERFEPKTKTPPKRAAKVSKAVKVTCFDIPQTTSEGKAICGILLSGSGTYDLREWLKPHLPVWISLSNLERDFKERVRQLF